MTSPKCWIILLFFSFTSALKMTLLPSSVRRGCKVVANCSLDAEYADVQPDYDVELWTKRGSSGWTLLASMNLSNGAVLKCEANLECDSRDDFLSVSFNASDPSNFTSYKCVFDLDEVQKDLISFTNTCSNACQNARQCHQECSSVACVCNINWEGVSCNRTCRTSASIESEDSVVAEGTRVTLSCQADLANDFYWSRLESCMTDDCKVSNASDITIEKSTVKDSGLWYCFAVNDGCTKRSNYSLTVVQPTTHSSFVGNTRREAAGVTSPGLVTGWGPETTTTITDETTVKANQFNPPPYWVIACSIFGGMLAVVLLVVAMIIIAMNVKDGEDPDVFPEQNSDTNLEEETPVKKPVRRKKEVEKKEDQTPPPSPHKSETKAIREETPAPTESTQPATTAIPADPSIPKNPTTGTTPYTAPPGEVREYAQTLGPASAPMFDNPMFHAQRGQMMTMTARPTTAQFPAVHVPKSYAVTTFMNAPLPAPNYYPDVVSQTQQLKQTSQM